MSMPDMKRASIPRARDLPPVARTRQKRAPRKPSQLRTHKTKSALIKSTSNTRCQETIAPPSPGSWLAHTTAPLRATTTQFATSPAPRAKVGRSGADPRPPAIASKRASPAKAKRGEAKVAKAAQLGTQRSATMSGPGRDAATATPTPDELRTTMEPPTQSSRRSRETVCWRGSSDFKIAFVTGSRRSLNGEALAWLSRPTRRLNPPPWPGQDSSLGRVN